MSAVWESAPCRENPLLVLLALADWANDDGVCWPSIETIASKTRIDRRSAQRIVRRLQKMELIEINEGGGRARQHRYTIKTAALRRPLNSGVGDTETAALRTQRATFPTQTATHVSPDPSVDPLEEPSVEEEGRGYPFDNFAVAEYVETLQPQPELAIFQAETIADAIKDDHISRAVWTDVLRIFKGNGYQRRYAGNAVDRYLSDMRDIASGKKEAPIVKGRVLTIRESMGINA